MEYLRDERSGIWVFDSYDDTEEAKYYYPGTNVLKNKLNIQNLDILYEAERDYSAIRQAECYSLLRNNLFSYTENWKSKFFKDITDKEEMAIQLAYYQGVILEKLRYKCLFVIE